MHVQLCNWISSIISWSLTPDKMACLGTWICFVSILPCLPHFGDHTLFSTLNVYSVMCSQQDHTWLCLDKEPQIQNTVVFEWECYSLCSFLDLSSNPSTVIYWLSGHLLAQLSNFSEPPFLISEIGVFFFFFVCVCVSYRVVMSITCSYTLVQNRNLINIS